MSKRFEAIEAGKDSTLQNLIALLAEAQKLYASTPVDIVLTHPEEYFEGNVSPESFFLSSESKLSPSLVALQYPLKKTDDLLLDGVRNVISVFTWVNNGAQAVTAWAATNAKSWIELSAEGTVFTFQQV